ncbi:MAG: PIG-L family deacetylase [Candidatus Pacebacteria bacterium]|nr:PIG-L family deacetylase [Candidatus Paceibacterota bacterium]
MIALPRNQTIAFFSPHPDDDCISAGALIFDLIARKNQIFSIYPTSSPRGVSGSLLLEEKRKIRHREARTACQIMGTRPVFLDLDRPKLIFNQANIKEINCLLKRLRPTIIFLPPATDAHPTHRKVVRIVKAAAKSVSVRQTWFYDSWSPLDKPNFIFFFKEEKMAKKAEAISCHRSQLERLNFLRAVKGLNLFRGEMGKELMGKPAGIFDHEKLYGEAFLIKE